MNMRKNILVLLLAFLVAGESIKATAIFLLSDTAGFSINCPQGWQKSDTVYQGQRVVFIRQPRQDESDNFMENVNVITQEVGSVTLEDYVKINLTSLQDGLDDYKKGMSGTFEANGYKFQSFRYSYSYQTVPIEAIVYFLVQNGTAYVITCSAHGGELKKYEKIFRDIVGSFKIQN